MTIVIGVLNVTPDSFSDGGRYESPASAVEAGVGMVADGADWVDVGGESTRPGAERVSLETELERVVPVVAALASEGVAVSIDTTRAPVARACVAAGARMVNDVSGGLADPSMLATVAELALHENAGDVLAWIALAATANTTIILLMAAGRMVYSMARSGTLPPFLGKVHGVSGVPFRGLVAVAVPAALMALWGDIGAVADTTNFVLFCAFGVVNAAVISLRVREPGLARPFRSPGVVPFRGHRFPVFPLLAIASLGVLLFLHNGDHLRLGWRGKCY